VKKILVIQPLRPEALTLLAAREDVRVEVVTDYSAENLMRRVADADAITVRDAPLSIDVLEAAPGVKVIARHGVGYDNIPIDYCTARRLPVALVGDVNAVSVAEHTMLLMLAVARKMHRLDAAIRRGDFAARTQLIGIELRGRTLLIVGFGRIGREVARRAMAFGMNVQVFDPYTDKRPADVVFVDGLNEGLRHADIVSLHVPLSAPTRNLIGSAELALLRPGAILINTARGGVVDEAALLLALQSGHVRGAGLDTFLIEPLPGDHPLALEPNVVLSPHSAALTEESLIAMGLATARNALAGLDGNLDPEVVVNRSVLDVGRLDAAQ
jgi:D-3-phosphoglycerate dehydrogenase / 2-oxoglutarate reductase